MPFTEKLLVYAAGITTFGASAVDAEPPPSQATRKPARVRTRRAVVQRMRGS
jgi:hypothetical protein